MKHTINFLTIVLISSIFVCSCAKTRKGQPYATQKNNSWSKNACGAFSMAYFLAETNQISGADVEKTAKKIYENIRFDPSAGFGDYSDPFKMMKEIAPNAGSVSFKLNYLKPEQPGEKLIAMLFQAFGADVSQFDSITDLSSALGKDEYVIEILVPRANVDFLAPMNNPLHYVLTYWKDGTLYTLDPGRGKEEPRQNFIDGTTTKWCFCNAGIFLKP